MCHSLLRHHVRKEILFKDTLMQIWITQEFLRLRMRNFQGIIFGGFQICINVSLIEVCTEKILSEPV